MKPQSNSDKAIVAGPKPSLSTREADALVNAIVQQMQKSVPKRLTLEEYANRRRLAALGCLLGAAFMALGLVAQVGGIVLFGTLLAMIAGTFAAIQRLLKPALPSIPTTSVRLTTLHFEPQPVSNHAVVWHSREGLWPKVRINKHRRGDVSEVISIASQLREECRSLPTFLQYADSETHSITTAALHEALGTQQQTLYDVEARLVRHLRKISANLARLDHTTIEASAVPAGLHSAIRLLGNTVPNTSSLVIGATRQEQAADTTAPRQEQTAALTTVSATIRALLDSLAKARSTSCSALTTHAALVQSSVHDASLTMLCPLCNAQFLREVATTRFAYGRDADLPPLVTAAVLRWRPSTAEWECNACAGTTRTPLPVPRVLVECLSPAVALMLAETHEERQRIYADIDNQKRLYKNDAEKELFQRRDSHRRDSRPLVARLAEVNAQAEATTAKLAAFGALMMEYKVLEEKRLAAINAEAQSIVKVIHQSQQQFEERFKQNNAAILNSAIAKMDVSAELARVETRAQFEMFQRIAIAGERTAVATERTALASETTAAVQMAWAREAGLLKPSAWNLSGQLEYFLDGVAHDISGKSAVAHYLPQSHGR